MQCWEEGGKDWAEQRRRGTLIFPDQMLARLYRDRWHPYRRFICGSAIQRVRTHRRSGPKMWWTMHDACKREDFRILYQVLSQLRKKEICGVGKLFSTWISNKAHCMMLRLIWSFGLGASEAGPTYVDFWARRHNTSKTMKGHQFIEMIQGYFSQQSWDRLKMSVKTVMIYVSITCSFILSFITFITLINLIHFHIPGRFCHKSRRILLIDFQFVELCFLPFLRLIGTTYQQW